MKRAELESLDFAVPDPREIGPEGLTRKPFPASRAFRACFIPSAHASVCEHARESIVGMESINEVGGFLVGRVYCDEAGPYLEIKAALRGRHTRNEGTEVAFTPETWAAANAEKDRDFPDDSIVGWYHTHPRFGIFLSDRDRFVHQHSFGQPWAAAFVVDPVQNLEGLFTWCEGETRRMQEYWVGTERKVFVETEARLDAAPDEPPSPRKSQMAWGMSIGVAVVALILIAVFAIFYYRSAMEWADERQLVAQALISERQDLDRAAQIITELQTRIDTVARQARAEDDHERGELKQVETSLSQVIRLNHALQRQVEGLKGQRQEDRGEP
jgi:proteasome lid subunit RPN8/RPN11